MMRRYTQLGAVPAIADRSIEYRDAMLAHTGNAARKLMATVKKRPVSEQVSTLNRALASFDEKLPSEVLRVATHLAKQGLDAEMAMERALTLALADASIDRVKQTGHFYQQRKGYPVGGLGLGSLGDAAADTVAQMFQGIACSTGLRDATSEMVGRQEGADAAGATSLGFEVLRGMSMCSAATPPPPPPPPVQQQQERSMVVPIVIGVGVLAVVGGGIWMITRKK